MCDFEQKLQVGFAHGWLAANGMLRADMEVSTPFAHNLLEQTNFVGGYRDGVVFAAFLRKFFASRIGSSSA